MCLFGWHGCGTRLTGNSARNKTLPFSCIFGSILLTHSFLVVSTWPITCWGSLDKGGASIFFAPPSNWPQACQLFLLLLTTQSKILFPCWTSRWISEYGASQTPQYPNITAHSLSNYKTLSIASSRPSIHSLSKLSGDLNLLSLTS